MKVVVVGGGLAGLFTASELVAAGVEDVVVLDQNPRPGGVAQTVLRNGFSLEPAAGSFNLPHPHLGPILSRAGVEVDPARSASTRFVYRSGRLVELPASPRAILAPLLPWSAKLRALAEPLVPPSPGADETVATFCRRRFGAAAGDMIAWLMVSGVFAGDPHEISVTAAFPGLAGMEEEAGSVVRGALRGRRTRSGDQSRPRAHLPVGGMTRMAKTIASGLGDGFRSSFPVSAIRPKGRGWVVEGADELFADSVVLATHPQQAARLVDPELAAHLTRSVSAPVVTVGLGGSGRSPVAAGFGALVTPDNLMISRGVLFESSYADGRAPDGSWLLKVIAGGALFPGILDWEDERVVDVVSAEVERILGTELSAQFSEVVRHRPGIPQYVVGHRAWLSDLGDLLARRPGLHLTGWGYRGVGVTHQASDAVLTAARVLARSADELG